MKPSQKVFHILDLDRTLLDTSKLSHALKEIIAKDDKSLAQNIHDEALKHAHARTSFFIFEYIAKRVGEEKLKVYLSQLHNELPAKTVFLPGAVERITFAKSKPGWGMGIMTYGSRRDQMIKLKLMGLHHERLLITNTPNKSEIIRQWKQEDGRFKLPLEFGGHTVNTLTLTDDKHVAFENLPAGIHGQWVSRAALGGVNELKYVSSNIRVYSNLERATAHLRQLLS